MKSDTASKIKECGLDISIYDKKSKERKVRTDKSAEDIESKGKRIAEAAKKQEQEKLAAESAKKLK